MKGHSGLARLSLSRIALAAMLPAMLALGWPAGAGATTYAVQPGPDVVAVDSTCGLREAVVASANDAAGNDCAAGTGSDTIQLAGGTYAIDTDNLLQLGIGDSTPGDSTTLLRVGSAPVTLAANGGDRVIRVPTGSGPVAINGITIRGGRLPANEDGAGVSVGGNTTFSLTNSLVTDNDAGDGANLLATGGGIGSSASGTLISLINVTVSGNSATGHGGGISLGAAAGEIRNVTVTDNHADVDGSDDGDGGGIHRVTGAIQLQNTIVAGNTDATGEAPDCAGLAGITNAGGSVFGTLTGCGLVAGMTDEVGDPQLAPLADNTGPTFTHALLSGTLAVDNGIVPCPPDDQRGLPRPFGPACDSGAFELQPIDPPPANPGPVVTPPVGPCDGLTGKAKKRCLCKQKKGKKRKKCLKKLKGRKKK
jgi:predicted outer membrane repeat protein